jgi:hypothetical protein
LAALKYWEIIADNLSKAGWNCGCVSAIDTRGRTIRIVDAHRGDGKRFVVHADEKLTAFIELESTIRKNSIDIICRRRPECTRAKSVGRLPPELHLTLFPQG